MTDGREKKQWGLDGIPRRTFLRSAASALALPLCLTRGLERERHPNRAVFVDPEEIPQLRSKVALPAMAHVRGALERYDVSSALRFLESEATYRRRLWDMPQICLHLRRGALLAAVVGDKRGLRLVQRALETLGTFPTWDYFLDGDRPIGIQRASEAVHSVVLALELVGDRLPSNLRAEMEHQLAEKGCAPCYRALWGMGHPDQVEGWRFAPDAETNLSEIDFSHWPQILRATNLHAVPLSALGVGSLYLQAKDPRTELWLSTARAHVADFWSRTVLPDGTYVENVAYWGYATSNLLLFLRGLQRVYGIDLFDLVDLGAQVEFALAMQAGSRAEQPDRWWQMILRDGEVADIVNFSDSWGSFLQTAPLAIAAKLRDPLAQKVGLERAGFWDEFTPIVFDPEVPVASEWPAHLERKRFQNDWVVWRSGWADEDVVVAFRSGGPANHEHADRNSVALKAFGEWLLRDPARASYDRRDEAWLLRLTEAHNAVLVDGRGHGYHDGREGTNPSEATATIRRYLDRGSWLSLTSDATPAYALVDKDILSVIRTLVWVVPRGLLLLDRVVARRPVSVALRFFPDNTDGAATLSVGPDRFCLQRPGGRLEARVLSSREVRLAPGRLPLSRAAHPYEYVEVGCGPGTDLWVATAIGLAKSGEPSPVLALEADGPTVAATWQQGGIKRQCRLFLSGDVPEVEVN
ncbi:MAG: heparinase II/III-family protein [candidate division KSB1 bacterium]|nr:heparinase II/III-family protein [candidate division KSB1 bacterium]